MPPIKKAKTRPDNGLNRIIVYRHGECIGPMTPVEVRDMRADFRKVAFDIQKASEAAHVIYYADVRDQSDRIVTAFFSMQPCENDEFHDTAALWSNGLVGAVHARI